MDRAGEGRGLAFSLIGEVFCQGLSAEGCAEVREHLGWEGPLTPEIVAVERARIDMEVPPFASVFLSADGLCGGDVAAEAQALRARCGLGAAREPDQIGEVFGLLGWVHGRGTEAQRREVEGFMLRWVPGFMAALEGVDGVGFHRELLRIGWFLLWQRGAAQRAEGQWALPAVTDPLGDPRTGLRGIAEFLVRPVCAGGFFTVSDLLGVARGSGLPVGFGSRADRLEGLLQSAAHYGKVREVCAGLEAVTQRWERWWREAGEQGWAERVEAGRGVIRRVGQSAAQASPGKPSGSP